MSQLARDLLVDEAHTDLLLLLTEGQTYLGIWVHSLILQVSSTWWRELLAERATLQYYKMTVTHIPTTLRALQFLYHRSWEVIDADSSALAVKRLLQTWGITLPCRPEPELASVAFVAPVLTELNPIETNQALQACRLQWPAIVTTTTTTTKVQTKAPKRKTPDSAWYTLRCASTLRRQKRRRKPHMNTTSKKETSVLS